MVVAAAEPLDFDTLDSLRFILNSDVEVAIAPKDELTEAINRYYGGATVDESVDSMLQEFTDSDIGARRRGRQPDARAATTTRLSSGS